MHKLYVKGELDKSKSREINTPMIGYLPITCYEFELFKFNDNGRLNILKSSVLIKLPKPTLFQRFKNWLKSKLN